MDERAKYAALHDWFLSPQGQGVAMAFTLQLEHTEVLLRGNTLLQLGLCGNDNWLQCLNYPNQWFISPFCHPHNHLLCASLQDLPLDRNSIDCVIAPFSIEATPQKIHLLNEIDRVLNPMGHVIFLGINPYSLWGLSLRTRHLSCLGRGSVRLRSALWVKHAMLMRGYYACELSSFYYIPPVQQQSWIERLEFLNQMGKMIWPFPTGFYCLIMQKHETGKTRIACESHFDFARV